MKEKKGACRWQKVAVKAAASVKLTNGLTADLSESPLQYGADDPDINGAMRTTMDSYGDKWAKLVTERYVAVNPNGRVIMGEIKGTKNRVNTPVWVISAATADVHNHPRDKDQAILGGTFSTDDIWAFANFTNLQTRRVKAAEGTYSITKRGDFDSTGLLKYFTERNRAHQSEYSREFEKIWKTSATYEENNAKSEKAFNKYLVNLHNDLLAGQKQYGYSYTLERPK